MQCPNCKSTDILDGVYAVPYGATPGTYKECHDCAIQFDFERIIGKSSSESQFGWTDPIHGAHYPNNASD